MSNMLISYACVCEESYFKNWGTVVFISYLSILKLILILVVTPQTQKGPKHEKNVSNVPIDFVPFDKSIQIKSY